MGAVARLARTLRALAKVPSQLATPFADWATRKLQDDLRSGQDPYGKHLPALRPATVRKKGHSRVLIDTETLANEVKAVPLGGAGIGLDGGPDYGALHITGQGARGTVRAYLPTNVLPATWRAELQRLLTEKVKEQLK